MLLLNKAQTSHGRNQGDLRKKAMISTRTGRNEAMVDDIVGYITACYQLLRDEDVAMEGSMGSQLHHQSS